MTNSKLLGRWLCLVFVVGTIFAVPAANAGAVATPSLAVSTDSEKMDSNWTGTVKASPFSPIQRGPAHTKPLRVSNDTPFADSAFWYQTIPRDTPVNPKSAIYVDELLQDLQAHGTATVNTGAYAPPIYVASSAAPRYKVSNSLCGGPAQDPAWLDRNWSAQFDSVPVPAEATPAPGADGELVIWSPATQEVWEMWHFERTSNGLKACWGGKISNAKNSDGVHTYPFGVAASGLSLLGGTMRISELQAGQVNHAIEIGVNRPRKAVHSWPANRDDGTWDSADAIPEGQRFRLDPSIDVDKLAISPIAKVIARAAQQYGLIVRDNTAGPVIIYGEDASPYVRAGNTNPYWKMFGSNESQYMIGFPWDRLQALPFDYGKP